MDRYTASRSRPASRYPQRKSSVSYTCDNQPEEKEQAPRSYKTRFFLSSFLSAEKYFALYLLKHQLQRHWLLNELVVVGNFLRIDGSGGGRRKKEKREKKHKSLMIRSKSSWRYLCFAYFSKTRYFLSESSR